jgi:hypothetical protein
MKSWKQPLAEKQEKTVYIRPKVVRPFSGPCATGATCTRLPFFLNKSHVVMLNSANLEFILMYYFYFMEFKVNVFNNKTGHKDHLVICSMSTRQCVTICK